MIPEIAVELTKIWSSTLSKPVSKNKVFNAYTYFEKKLKQKTMKQSAFILQQFSTKDEEKK